MKLFGLLRKPEWEHANPERRARAVARSDEPALTAKLPELAQADPAPAVRIAALARVDDLSLLERRLRGEREPDVAAAARSRLNELLGGKQPAEGAEALVGQLLDDPLLQTLAGSAATAGIRRAALERIDKPGLWLERCQVDPDPALRRWALERIDDPDALARIAESVRKRDKRLARAAREKFEALGVAAGDPAALRRRALELGEQFGQLSRQLPDDRDARQQALLADWAALRPRVDADLQRRIDGAAAMAEAALAGARGDLVRTAPPQPDNADEPESPATTANTAPDPAAQLRALAERLPPAEQGDALAVLDRLEAELAALSPTPPAGEVRAVLEQIHARRRDIRQREAAVQRAEQAEAWKEASRAFEAALDAGHPGPAREARERCAPLATTPAQHRELTGLDARLAELERWQRWSGSKARQRLCDEAAELAGSGLHPDALATRLRELQEEWARLDTIDGDAAPGPEHGLTRRFRALCGRAIAPARAYFAKRESLRRERAESVDELLARSEALPEGEALRALRQDIAGALRDLDSVPPAQRGEYGRRLRERLQAIDAAQATAREAAVLDKRRLLARLRRDLGAAEPAARIGLAKSAQSEWKRLPRGTREQENALWSELRELVDPLFAGERERSAEREAQQAAQRQAAQAILDELAALVDAEPERLLHAPAHLEQLQARWRALPLEAEAPARPARGGRPMPRRAAQHPMQARFDRLQAQLEAAMAAAERQREAVTIEALCEAGALLDARDAASSGAEREGLQAQLEALPLAGEDRSALCARLEGDSLDALDGQEVERLVVGAELYASADSPAESATLRREAQMQRLAAKLEGGTEAPAEQQLRQLLRELQGRPLQRPDTRAEAIRRWRRAWDALTTGGAGRAP
ncbi:DUF349 domain-containing protein [Pseudomarimonas salicorniae]|uniref:DUF349 domain-containing protein n=1 Tax=Pseudomarimonas salicorniae TaxID=2933270 RepID=A0ABT0GJ01_9GAMM|nr:DUF349 domain-containing protein [Lysobacter sp. CAU 1642]MCK7594516.1 DUF349 domain-containing protein [Lysobacter sp. CAU 1642]